MVELEARVHYKYNRSSAIERIKNVRSTGYRFHHLGVPGQETELLFGRHSCDQGGIINFEVTRYVVALMDSLPSRQVSGSGIEVFHWDRLEFFTHENKPAFVKKAWNKSLAEAGSLRRPCGMPLNDQSEFCAKGACS